MKVFKIQLAIRLVGSFGSSRELDLISILTIQYFTFIFFYGNSINCFILKSYKAILFTYNVTKDKKGGKHVRKKNK